MASATCADSSAAQASNSSLWGLRWSPPSTAVPAGNWWVSALADTDPAAADLNLSPGAFGLWDVTRSAYTAQGINQGRSTGPPEEASPGQDLCCHRGEQAGRSLVGLQRNGREPCLYRAQRGWSRPGLAELKPKQDRVIWDWP